MWLLHCHVTGANHCIFDVDILPLSYQFDIKPGVPWSVTKTFCFLPVFPVFTSDMHSRQREDFYMLFWTASVTRLSSSSSW